MPQGSPRLRVVQWSTGNVGTFALRAILSHPELELVGLHVHNEDKEGRDAGELCGLPPARIRATRDADAILALDADCVCYTAAGDTRPGEAVADMARILASGKNVVSSSVVGLVHPKSLNAEWTGELEEACRKGGSSFFTSGIDPGFANDVLPLVLSGLSEHWSEIRIQEIVNYATYDQPEILFDLMGFGQALDADAMLFSPGVLGFAWGGVIRILAEGLGLELDEIREVHERRPAEKPIVIGDHTVEAGTTGAMRFEVQGVVRGRVALVVEHVTRLDDALAPDWPQSDGGYVVTIAGEPSMRCAFEFADAKGDHAVGGVILTATRLVNAIPAVCAAETGLLSALDLPLVTGRGRYRTPAAG